jgi:hypothetical protein
MNKDLDEKFFDRADAHISVSNEQLKDISPGKVSASMMYAASRFNAWWTACGFLSADDMAARRDENIDYFMQEYRLMLEENMDDYITNFDKYMAAGKNV